MLQRSNLIGNATRAATGGRWRIVGERIEPLAATDSAERPAGERAAGERATVLVPGEDVLLIGVDLPLAGRRQRLDALPFAIEDRIAAPIDGVHLALGEAIGPRRYLVGVVAHEAMARWTALADEAGLADAALVPEPLALAVPAEGEWATAEADGRSVIRCPDGTGFVVPAGMIDGARAAAGGPALVPATPVATPALDLRQGRYAAARAASPWRRVAIVAAAGLAAHALIAAVDTLALRHIADARRTETAAAVALVSPGTGAGGDLAATAADLVPAGAGGPPSRFLPLLDRAAAMLAGSGLAVRGLAYRSGTLALTIEGDEAAATRAVAALTAGGLSARRGPGVITVRGL